MADAVKVALLYFVAPGVLLGCLDALVRWRVRCMKRRTRRLIG